MYVEVTARPKWLKHMSRGQWPKMRLEMDLVMLSLQVMVGNVDHSKQGRDRICSQQESLLDTCSKQGTGTKEYLSV